jgi:hypothetical protein
VEMVDSLLPLVGRDPCALADTLGLVPCWQVALHLDLVLGQLNTEQQEGEGVQQQEEEEEGTAAGAGGGGGSRRKGHWRVSWCRTQAVLNSCVYPCLGHHPFPLLSVAPHHRPLRTRLLEMLVSFIVTQ